MRPSLATATTTRRDAEEAVLHAVLVVLVGLALAVALVSMNNPYVLVFFVAVVGAIVTVRSYEANEVRREFQASFPDAWDATIDALTRIGLVVVADETWYSATEGRIDAGRATVAIERLPGGVVRVRVRVGTISTAAHRRVAALILESVAKRVA
jgi:hypothetical protein